MEANRIALIAGDGVGPEVTAEARKVVDALDIPIVWEELPWGATWWHEHGELMPADATERLRGYDGILFGAVGEPASVPDSEAAWGLDLKIRQDLDLWANVRPVRLLDGIPCPLVGRGPADIDMLFVRENTEGEYADAGGRVHRGRAHEMGVDVSVFTRVGCERVARFAFTLAASRRGRLTNATKASVLRYGLQLWDEVIDEIAADFPGVQVEHVLVDALCARLIRDPGSVDVVIASNLFGDILTDLAGALQGGIGMSPSANIAPGVKVPGMFEPIHGSAPDIARQGVANPSAAVRSAAMMLDHLGLDEQARRVVAALEAVCRSGPRTRDVGGDARTRDVGDAVAELISRGGG